MPSPPPPAPASPVSIDTTETEAKHRERTLMAIPSDRETLERAPEPSPASDLQSSLRRRLHSTVAAVVVPDSSSKTSSPSAENLTTDSGEDSRGDTSSDADTRDRVVDGVDREEENKTVSVLNGRQYEDGGGRGQGQGTGGGVPAKFLYRASAPAHRKVKESPLSSDAIFKQSHAGLLNLCIVVLIAVNSRLIIENLMKYGLLIRAGYWFSSKSLRDWPLLMCCLTLPAFPLGAFMVEKLAQHNFISESVVISLHVIITTAELLYPVIVILRCDSAVLSGITLMLFASVVWLKLVSYAHTNYDMRTLSKSIDKEDMYSKCPEIDNLKGDSFKSLVYFMVAPTLCYQPSYPRTTCIRKGWVIRQVVKLVIFTGLMGFIIEQYINPIVQNSQHPLKGNFLNAIERVLKLSVPTLYVWLCMFYCFFHLWLNILAELLCFGDREFYKDWWNAKTIEEYWRMWNMPVHRWMIRHIYFPCLRNGLPRAVAILISFLVSAIFHEICIAVPCHIFKFWAFIGIMFQIPLVILTKYLQHKFTNSMVGNMIFWFFFSILGQPMCVLLYYHDVMNRKVRTE
ncbi:diacylglycerol O-acyltransferase 1-2-like [Phoenix dactylifera]|uniref:O-acyltransferase n=1 Tax=Phoenix dactylifera TaxID=42345 RepID=A0A8B7C7B1_PHODC|nr:diacylglycerol O-acyltransferase 1-2-like [Phoenix dactylifera]